MPVEPSSLFSISFVALALVCASGFIALVCLAYRDHAHRRRATIVALGSVVAIMGGSAALSAVGVTSRFSMPPPLMIMVALTSVVTVVAASRSEAGRMLATRLPLWILVGFQVFRVPLELLLHRAWAEGFMPIQMSYAGRNFDIVSGLLAAGLAAWAFRRRDTEDPDPPPWATWTFNLIGLALLINIVTVSVLSMPTPLRAFDADPPNVWVGYGPYPWLPLLFVQLALGGHILIFRRLLQKP